jgi:hypothetical protein
MSTELERNIERVLSSLTRAQQPLAVDSLRALSGVEERDKIREALERLIRRHRIVKLEASPDGRVHYKLAPQRRPSIERAQWIRPVEMDAEGTSFREVLIAASANTKSPAAQSIRSTASTAVLAVLRLTAGRVYRQNIVIDVASNLIRRADSPDELDIQIVLRLVDEAIENLTDAGEISIDHGSDTLQLSENQLASVED